jgi:hypothetical protein
MARYAARGAICFAPAVRSPRVSLEDFNKIARARYGDAGNV